MGNQYLSTELYNEEFKNSFLEDYEGPVDKDGVPIKKTMRSYRYIFQKSFNTESLLDKDIYDFNDSELNTLIHSFRNGTVFAVASNISILTKYLDYAVKRGYIRVNLLQDVSGFDDLVKFVDRNVNNNKYITREELEEITDTCINRQDAYPIAMAFYGFKGDSSCEIRNLKVEHVNQEDMTIYIESRDKTFTIDKFLMDIIVGAMKEDEYKKMLTDGMDAPKVGEYVIHPNDYVMRVALKKDNAPVNNINIGARLNRVKTYTGKPYITITSIYYSGILDKARVIYAKNGEVTKEDWITIGEQYNILAAYWSKNKQRFDGLLECPKESE